MEVIAFLLPFVLLGGLVLFVAFSGGPGAAREAYLTRGSNVFRATMVFVFVVFGLLVPGVVIAEKDEQAGGVGALRGESLTEREERGKELFQQQCATCHTLAAVQARGVTGPSLDRLGEVQPERIVNAIENGGTGQGQMPADLLQGEEAEAVARYVAKVAGAQ
jgi:cytochrome c553